MGDDLAVGRFVIDDNRDVLRRARRHHRLVVGWLLAIGAHGLGSLVAAIVTGEPGLLFLVALAVYGGLVHWSRFTWRGKLTWPVTRSAVADRIGEEGVVVLDETGMEIRHPVLAEALHVTWDGLRAFAVEPTRRPRTQGRHPAFPIRRTPGSLRVIGSEPSHFLGNDHVGGTAERVALASIDLGSLPPNVAVLFTDPRNVTIAAPACTGDHGWTPPERSIPAIRAWRDLRVPGVYLRVLDGERFRRELEAHGVRHGFTSEDWRHATGTPRVERAP